MSMDIFFLFIVSSVISFVFGNIFHASLIAFLSGIKAREEAELKAWKERFNKDIQNL